MDPMKKALIVVGIVWVAGFLILLGCLILASRRPPGGFGGGGR